MRETVSASYFADMYAKSDDPWGFSTRWYERRKYALTLAALSSQHYGSVFEPGCSIGVLSAALAPRCDSLTCTDLSPRAVALAAQQLAPFGDRVDVRVGDIVGDWPTGRFDLIVLSEVLYYLDDDGLATVIARLPSALAPGAEIIAVHWRHPVPEYPRTGDDVHEALLASALIRRASYLDPDFRVDVLADGEDGLSTSWVADREGLTVSIDTGAS